jgi:DDE superfamily endonuclease
MTPLYGWSKRGQRAYGVVPRNRGHNTTILVALSLRGVQAAMTLQGPADRLVFEAFGEQVLVPTLRPGQIVVLDNLSIHKTMVRSELG